jgi:hypothetical protein
MAGAVDPGDISAWQLRGTLYLQALTSSGSGRIFRQTSGGQVGAVTVPRTAGDNWIVTTRGPLLLLRVAQSPCSDNHSLLWFDPVTRH